MERRLSHRSLNQVYWRWTPETKGCRHSCRQSRVRTTVALGAPAIELLHGLSRVVHNPYVFPGTKDRAHLVGLQKIWHQLRNRTDLPDVRLHDLRHSFASVGAASGDSLLIIGKLLGHKNAASTQRYAHLGDDPLRAAANRISQQIATAMNGLSDDPVRSDADRIPGTIAKATSEPKRGEVMPWRRQK